MIYENTFFLHALLMFGIAYQTMLLAGYLQDGRSGITLRPRGPADISPKTDPSSLPVLVPV